jgi:hypothetical protein
MFASVSNVEVVAWICFGVGVVILTAGVVIGLVLSFKETPKGVTAKDAKAKVEEALTKVQELKTSAVANANTAAVDQAAAADADKKGNAAESALEQIGSILGSLPENLRFSGLLVLIGAVLMSVGTIQFGGHPLFG